MDNQSIAKIFQEMGDILEIMNENVFRIRSYHRAALTIANYPHEMPDLYMRNPRLLEKIPGIGRHLRDKIIELIKTGKCKEHAALLKKFPKGFLDILRIRTVGPKKLQMFYRELGIKNIGELKAEALRGQLRDLVGMGEKSEAEILEAIKEYTAMPHERRLLHDAMIEANHYVEYLKRLPEIELIEPAGSLRRKLETIGDIDILCASKKPAKIMDYFVKYPAVANVISKGGTKSAVVLKNGMQVDLRVIDKKVFGAALHYFTGSKAHNIRVRDIAKRKGLKISEYGVFKGSRLIAGKTEKEVFASIKFPYIEPELREDRGEIELVLRHGKFPKLIVLRDFAGDLHIHSKWSDGNNSIEEIAEFYKKKGFEYIAITDHSLSVGVAHGLTLERLEMQWDEIDEINKDLAGGRGRGFCILKGAEVDIRKNGEIDYPDKILRRLDIVIASSHMRFKLTEEEQTRRIITALKN
ncbi:PHP domain-containing protein, partial [Candidatus Peregrinibacteria bacterium]|nr:PHP domain-containing protein [Candidatus Peregrinibacteria bacterium]